MKKYILSLFILAGLFASCNNQLEDVFDKNAATRVQEQVDEAYKILTGAANGWVMEFYPQENQNYGGVNILMNFDTNDGVVMTSETATNLTNTEKSTYTINRSDGAVLAFDTHNSHISYYADPSVTLGEGRQKGFMGDMAFSIKSASASEIVLQGTKTLNKIIMKPIPADVTWAEYLAKIKKVKDDVKGAYITRFEATVGENIQEMTINPTYPLLSFTYEDNEGKNHTVVSSYMYTDSGIKFYEPLEIFGEKLQNFTWDDEQLSFMCSDPGMTGRLQGKRTDYFRPYEFYLGTWKLSSSSASGSNADMIVTITEDVFEKSYILTGLVFNHSTYGAFNYPIPVSWNTDGRISIIGSRDKVAADAVGLKTITYTPTTPAGSAGVGIPTTYENAPVYLYGVTASGRITTVGAGITSKTDLIENRVDFENNGVSETLTGVGYYMHPKDGAGNDVNLTLGKFMVPMFMVKQ